MGSGYTVSCASYDRNEGFYRGSFFEEGECIIDDNFVFKSEQIDDCFCDPGFQHGQVDFGQIDL